MGKQITIESQTQNNNWFRVWKIHISNFPRHCRFRPKHQKVCYEKLTISYYKTKKGLKSLHDDEIKIEEELKKTGCLWFIQKS